MAGPGALERVSLLLIAVFVALSLCFASLCLLPGGWYRYIKIVGKFDLSVMI